MACSYAISSRRASIFFFVTKTGLSVPVGAPVVPPVVTGLSPACTPVALGESPVGALGADGGGGDCGGVSFGFPIDTHPFVHVSDATISPFIFVSESKSPVIRMFLFSQRCRRKFPLNIPLSSIEISSRVFAAAYVDSSVFSLVWRSLMISKKSITVIVVWSFGSAAADDGMPAPTRSGCGFGGGGKGSTPLSAQSMISLPISGPIMNGSLSENMPVRSLDAMA